MARILVMHGLLGEVLRMLDGNSVALNPELGEPSWISPQPEHLNANIAAMVHVVLEITAPIDAVQSKITASAPSQVS